MWDGGAGVSKGRGGEVRDKGLHNRFSFPKITVVPGRAMIAEPRVGEGRPGRSATYSMQARDGGSSGDSGSENGERCKILEDILSKIKGIW